MTGLGVRHPPLSAIKTGGDLSLGLTGWWKFDDEEGSTQAHDYSGNDHHGTYSGHVTYQIDGPRGRNAAALLDYGDADQENGKVSLPAVDYFPSGNFTVAYWRRYNQDWTSITEAAYNPSQAFGAQPFLALSDNGSVVLAEHAYADDTYQGGKGGIAIQGMTTNYNLASGNFDRWINSPWYGSWDHICITGVGQGSSPANVTVYVNGYPRATGTKNDYPVSAATSWAFQGARRTDTDDPKHQVRPAVCDMRTYDRALTANEVKALAGDTIAFNRYHKWIKDLSPTVAYYKMRVDPDDDTQVLDDGWVGYYPLTRVAKSGGDVAFPLPPNGPFLFDLPTTGNYAFTSSSDNPTYLDFGADFLQNDDINRNLPNEIRAVSLWFKPDIPTDGSDLTCHITDDLIFTLDDSGAKFSLSSGYSVFPVAAGYTDWMWIYWTGAGYTDWATMYIDGLVVPDANGHGHDMLSPRIAHIGSPTDGQELNGWVSNVSVHATYGSSVDLGHYMEPGLSEADMIWRIWDESINYQAFPVS